MSFKDIVRMALVASFILWSGWSRAEEIVDLYFDYKVNSYPGCGTAKQRSGYLHFIFRGNERVIGRYHENGNRKEMTGDQGADWRSPR